MEQGGARQSWLAKNWWWAVPVGCLATVLLCIGSCSALCAGTCWSQVEGGKQAYERSLELARHDPRVIERLGEPIERAGLDGNTKGALRVSNRNQEWEIEIPIRGPRGQARLRAVARQNRDDWSFDRAEVVLESGESIDLLTPAANPPH